MANDYILLLYFTNGIRASTILVENQRVFIVDGQPLPIYVTRMANDYISNSWVTVYLFVTTFLYLICVALCYLFSDYFYHM
uniref:Putative ovule protein n=1 Tax=Solanum chacoense TaxID=4108 RepID=A0A0V0I2D7_SOLCH